MLLLMFEIGGKILGLPARRVVEVVPSIPLEPFLSSSRACVGLANYRGTQIRIYDLTLHIRGQPAVVNLTTRIIVVDGSLGGTAARVGFLAENVTETINVVNDDAMVVDPTSIRSDIPTGRVAALDVDATMASLDLPGP